MYVIKNVCTAGRLC